MKRLAAECQYIVEPATIKPRSAFTVSEVKFRFWVHFLWRALRRSAAAERRGRALRQSAAAERCGESHRETKQEWDPAWGLLTRPSICSRHFLIKHPATAAVLEMFQEVARRGRSVLDQCSCTSGLGPVAILFLLDSVRSACGNLLNQAAFPKQRTMKFWILNAEGPTRHAQEKDTNPTPSPILCCAIPGLLRPQARQAPRPNSGKHDKPNCKVPIEEPTQCQHPGGRVRHIWFFSSRRQIPGFPGNFWGKLQVAPNKASGIRPRP